MTTAGVAQRLGLARSEVEAYKDEQPRKIAQDLGIAYSEALLIAAEGTPTTVPGAPTSPAALPNSATSVNVSFSPPASNGGAEITHYIVTSTPGGFTAQGPASPITVDAAYVAATGYTFTVRAVNAIGEGTASGPTNQVLPNP